MNDILEEDRCQLQTDAMEVCSVISIGESIRHFGVFCETRWNLTFLEIPDNPFKVMEGVVGLLRAAITLLDAMEASPMLELVCVLIREEFRLLMEGAALFCIGLESVIEKTLYSGVSSRPDFIPRVQISGNGPLRGYIDE